MHKALLIDLYAMEEFDLSLALGLLKAHADADPGVREAWEVEFLRLPAKTPPEEVVSRIVRSGAAVAGFSCYSWNVRAVEQAVSKLPDKERPLVVLGGVEVTPDPAGALHRNRKVDAVVFGEGEETFRALLLALREGAQAFGAATAGGIKGLAWRDAKSVKTNPERPPIEDLGTVPSPYLAGAYGDLLRGRDRVMVETARGCPFRCAYCYESRGFSKVRSFPVERVKEETAFLVRQGVKEIVFLDTNFNHDRGRALEILAHLKSLGGRVRYAFELRAEPIDDEVARAVSALDYFAEVGLQSTNPAAMEAVGRPLDLDRFKAGLRRLLEAGVYRPCSFSAGGGVTVDVMMGLPNDSLEDVLASFDFAFSLSPSKIALSMTKILPGTALFEDAKKYRFKFEPDAQYQVTSSRTMSKKDVDALLEFREAVDLAVNRVHAVRTLAWAAEDLKTRPSAILMEIGRQIGKSGRPGSELTVKDLADLLAEFCEGRGSVRVADASGGKLTSEGMLNVLQKLRERRRTWWANAAFSLGHWFLRTFWGLPPLPVPAR
ncbi:MAG: radical SAM protein [Planctomycetes bacterium]|nr:radical SAM protein [Planctomycetota bacterium]